MDWALSPGYQSLVKKMGLPLPTPPTLSRTNKAIQEMELLNYKIGVRILGATPVTERVATALARQGASVELAGVGDVSSIFRRAGEAWARSPLEPSSERLDGALIDLSALVELSQLEFAFAHIQGTSQRLKNGAGIVVVVPQRQESLSREALAANFAVEGMVRSLAKEIGRKGARAILLQVPVNHCAIEGVLAFIFGKRSAYINGQVWQLCEQEAAKPTLSSLAGECALVTGAARGIGREIALKLAREGAHVIALDRPGQEGELDSLAAEIRGESLSIDLSDPAAPEQLLKELTARHRVIDVLVHNAGLTRDRTLAKMTSEEWNVVLQVNLHSIIQSTEALMAARLLGPSSRVILMSSVSGVAGNLGQANYAATKAALIGYMQALEKGVDSSPACFAIAPGFIETPMTAKMPAAIREVARRLNSFSQGGRAEDVADAACFLALPSSMAMRGNLVRVCGGAIIGA